MDLRDCHICVTGGAGYIGSILVPTLLQDGAKHVTVIDNFMHRQATLLDCCDYPNLTVIRGSARDVAGAFDRFDVIIPLAAHVGAHACDVEPEASYSTNVLQIRDIMLHKCDEAIVIFPHTNTGYGTTDPQMTVCTEETPMKPISLYGIEKCEAENLLDDTCVSLRLATVFGASPRMRMDLLVNHIVYKAVTDGCFVLYESDFMRNYIHVRDVADAFLFAIEHYDEMRGQKYNCGNTEANMSKRELCAKVKAHVPDFQIFEGHGKDRDQRNYLVSNAKLEALGWSCTYSLDDGIDELLRAYTICHPMREWGNA